jgi:DNA helicase-2/ATP-dependent DNA helicase PcrA
VRCRICSRPVVSAAERKLGRCADCPFDVDEALFDRLRAWRLQRARADEVPAFVVFTDATLTAIAESRPTSQPALLAVSGVGREKLERYGADVLAVVAGEMC